MGAGGQVKDGALPADSLLVGTGLFAGTKSGCRGFAAAMELVRQAATFQNRRQG